MAFNFEIRHFLYMQWSSTEKPIRSCVLSVYVTGFTKDSCVASRAGADEPVYTINADSSVLAGSAGAFVNI